jgi:hypothetical protein
MAWTHVELQSSVGAHGLEQNSSRKFVGLGGLLSDLSVIGTYYPRTILATAIRRLWIKS